VSRLDSSNNAYSRFRDAIFRMHIIRDKEVESLWPICDEIRIALRDNDSEAEVIQRYKKPVFRLRRITTGLPLPFNSDSLDLKSAAEEIKALAQEGLGLIISKQLTKAADIAVALHTSSSNQLAIKLRELVRNGSTIAIQDGFWRQTITSWLASEFPDFKTNVITFRELSDQDELQHLIFIGSPSFVAYRHFQEPDFRFARDPKSLENDFVMYGFGDPSVRINGLMSDRDPLRVITATQPMVAPAEIEDLDGESEWTSIEHSSKLLNTADTDTEVLARFIGLSGGHHVFIEDDPRTSVFVLMRDYEDKLDVSRTSVRDLRTSSFLLLRTKGASHNLISEIADELGAKKLRPSQLRYKSLLQNKIKELGGTRQVSTKLENEYELSTNNLADWAYNAARIGPGSKSNFLKLCEFLSISTEAEKIWKHLEKIRALHVRAGNEAMNRLKASIRSISPTDKTLKEDGYLTRSVPGCGEIGVYRIEHIGETQLVSVYDLQILRS
jgi:hypothetical protein